MKIRKKALINILLVLISLCISLFVAEYAYRKMIFGKSSAFKKMRDPGLYASIFSDDYWKLYYLLDGQYQPPEHPHPILGWTGPFNRDNYSHWNDQERGGRRPVLLFGDSFAQCVDSVSCFEEILNADSVFSKDHYLLNYGVGGYGVDQIFLLCSLAVNAYERPFVILSVMPTDMDRCILTVRTGQKPYFISEGDALVLKGVPIDSIPGRFFSQHPPSIRSYLWERFLHSKLNVFSKVWDENAKYRKAIRNLNPHILLKTDSLLTAMHIDHVFMVFDNMWNSDGNWRIEFLEGFLNEHELPWFSTTAIARYLTPEGMDKYIIPGNGHPTSLYNKKVAEEIKKYILKR